MVNNLHSKSYCYETRKEPRKDFIHDPANNNGHENLDYIPEKSGRYIKLDPLGNW
jgi:hypothetical protein